MRQSPRVVPTGERAGRLGEQPDGPPAPSAAARVSQGSPKGSLTQYYEQVILLL
jgi:hypothetical protein